MSIKKLPWSTDQTPLMLAPMQGLTNRALRAFFAEQVRPDTLFTEFMRVGPAGRKQLKKGDLSEMCAAENGIPLVVQLIGHGRESLVTAAQTAQQAGATHINLNLGCPYGRMTSGLTGGKMLQRPDLLAEILPALREVISGTFSVKVRAGYDRLEQIFELLPLFTQSELDFLVLHPRTVVEEYRGEADHTLTAEVVRQTQIPVIANGDIRNASCGRKILAESGAAGLMIGRGAISDPWLFERLRGNKPDLPTPPERATELRDYLSQLLERYQGLYCGEKQILDRFKNVLIFIDDLEFKQDIEGLKKCRANAEMIEKMSKLRR
jgi:tRNA-dihydrouridine synthase B